MSGQPETRRIKTNKVFEILQNSNKRITSLRGGTRSGKTYNVLIYFVMQYLQETGKVLTIARETMPALKASAMRDFFEILDVLGIYKEADHNRTRNEYTLNGNLIEFIGVSESDRVRGRKRDDLFINEVNEITLDSWRQLSFRTTRKIVIDYNPSEPEGFVYEDIENRDDCDLHVTTYLDNPFLEKAIVDEIERLQDADEEYWKVYGLGVPGSGATKVYTHWREGETPDAGQKVYGLDFGYNNATALVEVTLYDNILYWREMLYQSKLTNSDLIEKLKTFPELNGRTIIADCAEPNRIEEISRAGFKIEPANKAVKDGIDFVKSHPLRIDGAGENLLRETKRYAWKLDKDNKPTDDVVKFDDHCFVAGTMVATNTGAVPIELVRAGDHVLTRKGFRPVISSGLTAHSSDVMSVEFSDGSALTGTPNHPVFVEGRGFVRMDAMRYNDYIVSEHNLWKLLPLSPTGKPNECVSTDISIAAIPNLRISPIAGTSAEMTARLVDTCTERFGDTTTAKFPKASTSITKSETTMTTASGIWNASRKLSISKITSTIRTIGFTAKQAARIWQIFNRSLRNGINQKLAGSGTENTRSVWRRIAKQLRQSVSNAIRSFTLLCRADFVPMSASLSGGGTLASMMFLKSANDAAQISQQTNTIRNGFAPVRAQHMHDTPRVAAVRRHTEQAPVYNLTVADTPEFFANGVLVHNCMDAGRYASYSLNVPAFEVSDRERRAFAGISL